MMIVQNTSENRKNCLCPECTSYPHDCEAEILYCSMGKVFVILKPLDAPAASALFILRTNSRDYTSATRKKSGQVIP